MSFITISKLSKAYQIKGHEPLKVLRDVSVEFPAGKCIAIEGVSGSGKTTLLQMIGGMDRPDSGSISITPEKNFKDSFSTEDLTQCSHAQREQWRREGLGFVFQTYHLMPELTAIENVQLPAWFRRAEARSQAEALLEKVGLKERMHHRPSELSGGEQQRVAIARALVNSPALVLADEPTGNLDPSTGKEVIELLLNLCREEGLTLVLVTHDPGIAGRADLRYLLIDGMLKTAEDTSP